MKRRLGLGPSPGPGGRLLTIALSADFNDTPAIAPTGRCPGRIRPSDGLLRQSTGDDLRVEARAYWCHSSPLTGTYWKPLSNDSPRRPFQQDRSIPCPPGFFPPPLSAPRNCLQFLAHQDLGDARAQPIALGYVARESYGHAARVLLAQAEARRKARTFIRPCPSAVAPDCTDADLVGKASHHCLVETLRRFNLLGGLFEYGALRESFSAGKSSGTQAFDALVAGRRTRRTPVPDTSGLVEALSLARDQVIRAWSAFGDHFGVCCSTRPQTTRDRPLTLFTYSSDRFRAIEAFARSRANIVRLLSSLEHSGRQSSPAREADQLPRGATG